MIYINHDNGKINAISILNRETHTPYSGGIPNEFYSTFSKGKYLFIDGEIVENPSWHEGNSEVITLPEDVPHRSILIRLGISSIEELKEIEDLTSKAGIGESRAQDIINYLTLINEE